jgi:ubiquinol-cytochrome c reductase cytochrome c1 subunit
MKKLIIAAVLALAPVLGVASGGGPALQSANIDLSDQGSLQRGAKAFVDNCMGCHSLKYMRYSRMAADLGIGESDLRKDYILGEAKPGDPMAIPMRPEDAEKWFGVAVPDLTLVTRWRSPDWVYTYLKSFYLDPTRPWGVNNLVFPAVGMPHVLQGLQGVQEPVMPEHHAEGASSAPTGVKLVQAGKLSPERYDGFARDLTNFLTYAGEPVRLERQRLGWYVLGFLAVFFILAYMLKKEYWKDIH